MIDYRIQPIKPKLPIVISWFHPTHSNQKSAIPTDKDRKCSQVQSHATEDNLNRNKEIIVKFLSKMSVEHSRIKNKEKFEIIYK